MDFLNLPALEQTFTGNPPFVANFQSALYDIMVGKRPQRPGTLGHDGLWELTQRCWNQDPGRRPTTFELLEFFRTSWGPIFLYRVADTYPIPPRFPGQRGTSATQALTRAPSVWTLVDPEVDGSAEARPDPHRKDTQDVDEPGPQDPSGPEPSTSGDRYEVPTPGEHEPPKPVDALAAREGDVPPQTQNDLPPPRGLGKFKEFIKSKSYICSRFKLRKGETTHMLSEELSCF
jgi:hypothetical protein